MLYNLYELKSANKFLASLILQIPKISKSMETVLPHTRVRIIMKSSLDTGNITNEVLYLMTKSTEMFIKHFSTESYNAKKPNTLKYEHLADLVQKKDNLEFLLQIVPQKIKVKDFKSLIEKDDNSSESTSESD